MAFVDHTAADKLRQLREARGYNSPEALAGAIKIAAKTADWGHRGSVDGWTLRRCEEGHVPGPRIRFVLSSYLGDPIWNTQNWKPVSKSVAAKARKAVPA
jgi:hypothetical protein